MEQIIYIKLLDEGTLVYRPIKALKVDGEIYKIIGTQPKDELWEFKVGEIVICDFVKLEKEMCLVAIKRIM